MWKLFIILILLGSLGIVDFIGAQEVSPSAVLERRAKLENELQQLEAQIEGYRDVIQKKQRESTSLERDIAIFDAKIGKAKLGIRARNLRINRLEDGINERTNLIGELLEKVDREKTSLSELLRKTNELDSTSLVEIVLGYEQLSDFFVEMDTFESVQGAMQISFAEIRDSKEGAENEREELTQKKSEETQLRVIQELEKKRLEQSEAEKRKILKLTKGEEAKYQEIVDARRKDAARIRSELFMLRGSKAIPFERAVEYANEAWRATGVRPAFLLGVFKVESDLGANLGSGNWRTDLYECYISIGYKTSAEKQKTAFLEIASELGLNPDTLPVSKAPYYGCGGAMGPAQFMPTTWSLYKSAIARETGNNPPNPWVPEDAFMASALLLKDNGAAAGGYTAERRAALRYLAGGNWKKSAYSFYGDDVMELSEKYQRMIDTISE